MFMSKIFKFHFDPLITLEVVGTLFRKIVFYNFNKYDNFLVGQVCFFIIQLLLFKAAEFRNRVSEFVKENSPEHWTQSDWHEKHLNFHKNYPEKFAPEGMIFVSVFSDLTWLWPTLVWCKLLKRRTWDLGAVSSSPVAKRFFFSTSILFCNFIRFEPPLYHLFYNYKYFSSKSI